MADYFLEAPDADLVRMGVVERARLPERGSWVRALRTAQEAPAQEARSFVYAWLADGKAIGFTSVKDIRFGQDASLHLHMWSAAHRGRGLGGVLFSLAALAAFDRFRLQSAVCEPKADNPMPNRMLAKAGFPLLGTRVGRSSELSQVTTLNRYAVSRAVAEAAVRQAGTLPPQSP